MANEENASTIPDQDEQAEQATQVAEKLESQATENNAVDKDKDESGAREKDVEITQEQLAKQLEKTSEDLQKAKQEAEKNWDLLLRARAELENYRRRAERDLENIRKYGLEKFAVDLLPVKDSMEMGLSAALEENQDLNKIREGMALTVKMFATLLDKFEIEELNPLGEAFNPKYHEAMSMAESEEYGSNTVMLVFQKGYCLNDRLIRPAKVIVVKGQDQGQHADET